MEQLFWGRSYTSLSSLGNEVFDMPEVISAHPRKELTWSPTCEPHPLPLTFPPCHPHFLLSFSHSSSQKVFFLYISLYKFSYFWAERAPCFGCEKSIAISSGRERGKEHTRERERGCYPCQSDPAWRLSSPLIALLISSPLSLDLGQQGPSAGADWRLSFSMISPTLCHFLL